MEQQNKKQRLVNAALTDPLLTAMMSDKGYLPFAWIRDLNIKVKEFLNNPNKKFFSISAHPGAGKSEYLRIKFLAWWMLRPIPEGERRRVIFISATHSKSELFTKELIPAIVQMAPLFGHTIKADDLALKSFTLPNGANYKMFGMDSDITGHHAELIMVDDVYGTAKKARSEAYVREVKSAFTEVIVPRAMRHCKFIFLQHRWHRRDITATIMGFPNSEHWNYRAIADGETDMLLGKLRPKGGTLVPSMYPLSEVLKHKKINPSKFYSHWQGDPTDDGVQMFEREDFRGYTLSYSYDKDFMVLDLKYERLELSDLRVYATCDTAFSGKKRGDYSVLQIWAYQEETDRLFLLKQNRGKPNSQGLLHWWNSAYRVFQDLECIYIEDNGREVEFATNNGVYAKPLKHRGQDKQARAQDVSNMARSGLVFIPKILTDLDNNKVNKDLLFDELEVFDAGDHDDQVDAMAYAAIVRKDDEFGLVLPSFS